MALVTPSPYGVFTVSATIAAMPKPPPECSLLLPNEGDSFGTQWQQMALVSPLPIGVFTVGATLIATPKYHQQRPVLLLSKRRAVGIPWQQMAQLAPLPIGVFTVEATPASYTNHRSKDLWLCRPKTAYMALNGSKWHSWHRYQSVFSRSAHPQKRCAQGGDKKSIIKFWKVLVEQEARPQKEIGLRGLGHPVRGKDRLPSHLARTFGGLEYGRLRGRQRMDQRSGRTRRKKEKTAIFE